MENNIIKFYSLSSRFIEWNISSIERIWVCLKNRADDGRQLRASVYFVHVFIHSHARDDERERRSIRR